MAYCPDCGSAVGESARYCGDCGTELEQTDYVTQHGSTGFEQADVGEPRSGHARPEMGTESTVVGRRVGAVIIDTVIVTIVGTVVVGLLRTGGPMGLLFLMVPVWFLYFWILEGMWGQTLGKKALGLVVVNEDGSSISYGTSLVRNLLRFIDSLFYYLVGFVVLSLSDRKQRLGDRVADTVVVRTA